MDQKTIAWVSYITLIGWIIALVSYNSSPVKSSLAKFHLRQSLGIMLTGMVLYFGIMILGFIMPFFFMLFFIVWIAMIILLILGLVAAVNGEEKRVPVLGDLYQRTLTFIN